MLLEEYSKDEFPTHPVPDKWVFSLHTAEQYLRHLLDYEATFPGYSRVALDKDSFIESNRCLINKNNISFECPSSAPLFVEKISHFAISGEFGGELRVIAEGKIMPTINIIPGITAFFKSGAFVIG